MRVLVGFTIIALLTAVLIGGSSAAWSQTTVFTAAELDEMFAPIALYPDPLLAQILPAATYPDQLDAASNLIATRGSSMIDAQPWDVSVKAVAHYPDVLKMMVDSPDWTIALGQAYVNQPDDVMGSIQRLRGKARLLGYLNSNAQQTVSVSNGYIGIDPAQPRYIYVPTYNPQVVYRDRPSYGVAAITFGLGLLIGSWLNNDINWHNRNVYYHGWSGPGWVSRSRPYVQYDNRYYVNSAWRNRPVSYNRGVRTRDINRYRQDLQQGVGSYATPGFKRPVPGTRPSAPSTRPSVIPGTTRPVPSPPTRPGRPTPRPPRPGVIAPAPGAGPNAPAVRPGTRPLPGVTTPATRPGTRPAPGFTRPRGTPGQTPTVQPGATRQPRPGVARPGTTTRQRGNVTAPAAKSKAGVSRTEKKTAPAAGSKAKQRSKSGFKR